MNGLNEQQLAFLQQFGFDAELFARWQSDVAAGRLSLASNAVTGDLLAPPPGSIQKLPSKSPNFWSVDQLARTRSSVGRSFRSVSSPFMVSLETRKPDSSNSGMGMKLAREPLSMAWKRRKNSSSSSALLAWSSACS